ncbi:MAG: phosphopantetheine-binding protein [Candidatus Binataceae bacterium]
MGTAVRYEDRVVIVIERLLGECSLPRVLRPDDKLTEAGLTSLDMVNLVLSVEAEFDLTIPVSHITPANFRSISTISALIDRLLGKTAW